MTISIPSTTLEKFTTFGDLLRFLRRRVGLTQMELADAVGYSHTQISRLEQNLRLPDIPTIENQFVFALGIEDEPKAVARLLELAANVRREDAPAPGLCPYKGLNFYDEADADLFVGREALTAQIVERILSLASNGVECEARFLTVVGASGSGKSSLVRAGVVPALRWNKISTDWRILIFTPTEHPLESLAASLTRESDTVAETETLAYELAHDKQSLKRFVRHSIRSKNQAKILLVVDQFEELFALCRSEQERISFIENLLAASSEADGAVIVVITLRADYYAACAGYVELREALARQQRYIGAMNDEELRRAIEVPAQRGRWEFEPGLVDLLLREVGQEPGALPLLSHALLETWERRRGRTLTLSGYASSHGVHGAIAETAETVFSDQFTHEQQAIARRIFLRLTELNNETSAADTRRRATFEELIVKPDEAEKTHAVLKALADARLITTSEDYVEVAHEALIREWPTLRGWLEDNREDLRLHRHLTEAAQEWQRTGRETDQLYRGVRLERTREWASLHQDEINALEGEFLEASIESSEQEAQEREAQRQRELEAARRLAETQRRSALQLRRRAFYLIGALALAVIAALTAGTFADRNAALAEQNASIAQTAQAASAQAIADFTRSEAQRLAAEANNLMLNHGDPNLIALLTIRSLTIRYTPAGDADLASLTTLEAPPREFTGHEREVTDVAFSPNGKYLATGSNDKTARLWDIATGNTIRVFSGHTDMLNWVAFSPDGKYLLTGSIDHTARLWDVASGETVQVFFGHTDGVVSAVFSPDGKTILTVGGADNTARIWDVATGETLHILGDHTGYMQQGAFSPDGKYALTSSVDGTARLWEVATGDEVRVFSGHTDVVSSVAFSPDGKYIATGSEDRTARLWDAATGEMVREFSGHQDSVLAIKFSPDGSLLLTGSADKTARLWDVATGETLRTFGGHVFPVFAVTFSPDGRQVATASGDRLARVWSLQTLPGGTRFTGHTGSVWQASFSPDSKLVITASEDGTARIWDRVNGRILAILTGHTEEVRSAVFSADGKLALTASGDGTARLWDAASGKELRRFEGHTDLVNRAIFSPDGKVVVTTSYDGTARVWDAQTAQTVVTYTGQGPGHVNRVAISPDGKTVATSGDDGTARTWDLLSGQERMVFRGHTDIVAGVAFSPDGRYLVTSSFDGSVRLWEVASGREIRRFAGHPGGAFGAAFSPDGKHVLTGGADGTARLWDVQTGQEERRFTGHTNSVRNVTFSPDGRYILTASNDNTARLWLTDLNDMIRAVCDVLTRDLTPDERAQFGIAGQDPTCSAQ